MDRLLQIARIASALAGAFALLSIGWLTLAWGPKLCRHVDGTLTRAEVVESKVYATMANVDQASRVWADSAHTQAAGINQLTVTASAALASARGTAQAATDTLTAMRAQADALGPLFENSNVLLRNLSSDAVALQADEAALNKAISDADGQMTDAGPKAQAILTATQSLMQENARTAADIRTLADKLAAPKTSHWQRIKTALDLIWRGAMLAK